MNISRSLHGIIDYIVGVALIAAPWIFGFSDVGGAAVTIPIVVGIAILVQSILTDYEAGVIKVIPFRTHLTMDAVLGAFLLLSPFLFGFTDDGLNAWLPHVIVGAGELAVVAMTRADDRAVSGTRQTV